MAGESLATGNNLSGTLQTLYDNYLAPTPAVTHISNLAHFEDEELFDILRGWPIEGALTDFRELASQLDPNEVLITRFDQGQWVQFSAAGKLELATSTTTAKQIMLALSDSDATDVVASKNRLPVLTSNFVARIPATLIITGQTLANFAIGAPVVVTDGYLDATVGAKIVVGTVRDKDTNRGTIDIEVN